MNTNCESCYYNFDGFCASHGFIHGSDDTYGMSVTALISEFPYGCSEFRINPPFLVSQDCDSDTAYDF